jgi:NAD(P)-dependent dehydrogenase (short-subunit alcohol dehydrogenase family)
MGKLAKTLEGTGIKVFQLDPGYVKTNMSAGVNNDLNWFVAQFGKLGRAMMAITPHQSAETIVHLSVAKSVAEPETSGKGEIYRFMNPWKVGDKYLTEYDVMEETNALYKRSREFVGLD